MAPAEAIRTPSLAQGYHCAVYGGDRGRNVRNP
jgi:hypothetical protein